MTQRTDELTREQLNRAKQRAALISLGVKLALTIGKFVAAGLSGSLALLSEAGNNLGDVAVTLMGLFAIRAAGRPADEEHNFGHGKIESLAALIETGFLFALAAFILIEALRRFWSGGVVRPDAFAYGVLIVSIIVDAARWISLNRLVRASRSQALAANALNFATDIIASSLALLGLAAASLGYTIGDAVAAIGVAAFVAVAGYRLARETIDTLIDTAPKGLSAPVRALIDDVPGVIAVDTLRLRPVGTDIHGEAEIKVSRTLSIDRVSAIRHAVAQAVVRSHPDVKMTVTAEPVALDDETIAERILLIANRRHVPVHHLTVQTVDGRHSVSFDAEVDGRMTLGQAHEIVTALEGAIADELGSGIEVESHIEPLDAAEIAGADVAGPTFEKVKAALATRLHECSILSDVHALRVRHTDQGLVVNYHCLVDPALPVAEVHAHVDTLDRKVRQDCPDIARIVGHAEPIKARDHN